MSTSAAEAATWSPLVPLRAAGSRLPLVLLPGLGGDARYYAELVENLGDDQPVYVFRPRGLDQELPPHITIADMLDDYLAALRELQPAGPYRLAGWSTGGTFAFALAEALERAGEEVTMLALFDSPLPSICDDVDFEDDARFFCDLVNIANRCSGADVRISYERLSRFAPDEQFGAALEEARKTGMIPPDTPESFVRRLVHVGEANVRVLQSYRPSALATPVLFFVPETKGALAELSGRTPPSDEDLGWSREVAQAVEIHVVPGDHFSIMIGESAAKIARELAPHLCIERAAATA
jgi:myxalamid-type polyketide synthase MxaB